MSEDQANADEPAAEAPEAPDLEAELARLAKENLKLIEDNQMLRDEAFAALEKYREERERRERVEIAVDALKARIDARDDERSRQRFLLRHAERIERRKKELLSELNSLAATTPEV